ncbi:type IV toxin-antitoxin system AbiEi family antitoxin domain-containing protein [Streptomyces cinnamoneus]|uniref:type IV toxin-antitoxin system AbiEi family antitoxin domain-containing protein n=1 Tax=Streptomyces cinnamoneus TaxID=53446 RepID=UPI00167C9AE1|nr:type IV toxin-antitoxin system AbiEi family antitoxin domain-containing protein [Streptomyces cinnamoneus]
MTGEETSLQALADAQGGVVLTAQALAAGWTRSRLGRLVASAGWTRIRSGVLLAPGREAGPAELLWTHRLLRPELVVSHWSAAMLHGVETGPPGGRPDFICPGTAAVKGATLHRLPLAPGDVTVVAGLRTTTVARTMADLLRAGPRDEALVAVDSALGWRHGRGAGPPGSRGRPLTTLDDIGRALTRAPALRGAVTAAWWLAMADPRSGSPAETLARLRMNDAGLHPETQAMLVVPATGRRVYPDFLFRPQGLAVETEGYTWHGTRAQHQRDVIRFNDLAACREVRRILRFTSADVRHRPAMMIRGIRSALA